EHLWRVHCRYWPQAKVMSTADLQALLAKARYQNCMWVEPHTGDFGHNEPLPIDPWVLGALLGDGCITGEGTVRFSSASQEVLDRLASKLPDDLELVHADRVNYRVVQRNRA
ncbi:hypothetical protein RZS08_38655, partial [Arthrospira platensis SPKY1]|nr:hypothetical protein [Arthrospira platensis SPKY1]